jgi:hypothetical protein
MAKRRGVEVDVEVDLDAEPDDSQWKQIKNELHTVGIDGRTLRATVSVPESRPLDMFTTALAIVGRVEIVVTPPVRIVTRARVRLSDAEPKLKKSKKKR